MLGRTRPPYTTAAYKGFGRRGALLSLAVIVVFGAVAPAGTPLPAPGLFGTTAAAFVPVMTVFGPAAFLSYLWLSRTATERSGPRWIEEQTARMARASAPRRPSIGFALPSAGLAALVLATLLWSGDTATTNAASPPAAAARPRTTIVMRNVTFTPSTLTVRAGQTVTWSNADRIPHDVVAMSGASVDSGSRPRVRRRCGA